MIPGVTAGERFRSWTQIQANAARAAGGFTALGVGEDDSVALIETLAGGKVSSGVVVASAAPGPAAGTEPVAAPEATAVAEALGPP